jgi:SAM-dependent methyltransferase
MRGLTRARVADVRVDDEGIFARSRTERVLDVHFDGRRIWSFWLHRDGTPVDGGHLVTWPKTLRGFLDGTARITLREHDTADADPVFDATVALGSGQGQISITTNDGRPIALDKSLRRVQTFDESRSDVEPLMRAIEEVLGALRKTGVEAFLAYGTLLGAVRDGRLIGHDSDADLGYVSEHTEPVDVMRESFRMQRVLVELGYRVTRYSGAAFKLDVIESDGTVRGLDVFGGFFRDGRLHLMGEIRTPFRREWIFPLGETTLEGHRFPAPADTDRMLTATYGKSWRVPDPAFHFATPASTHRRFNGWFRGIRHQRARWDRVYSRPPDPSAEPSGLASLVSRREPEVRQVVDIGCGSGGDVLWFARKGTSAVGLDFARKAFGRAARRAEKEAVPARFTYLNLLELRSVLSTAALVARDRGPRVVMARHLVDASGQRARRELWRAARLMLADGGRLYVEFLVRAGDDGYAEAARVRRRRPAMVVRELEAAGATVVWRRTLPVAGPRGAEATENPSMICRMVAQWDQ